VRGSWIEFTQVGFWTRRGQLIDISFALNRKNRLRNPSPPAPLPGSKIMHGNLEKTI